MKVDICSIMYNEEILLPLWIESWLRIPFINKIYLVDGGSTDRSVEIAKGYDRVQVMVVPWKNDFSRQRNIALKLSKSDIQWVFQPDIDELPCGDLSSISAKDMGPHFNQYIIPYVKFYDWDTLWFFKNNVPTLQDDMVYLAANKSTTTIFRKSHLRGYSKSLHEMPILNGEARSLAISSPKVELESLKDQFFMGHFDQTKHFEQARQNNTSVHFEMGMKRVRYRLISPAVYSGKTYDQEWAKRALNALENGDRSMIEELGKEQLKSFMDEHFILDDFDASGLFDARPK
jgi:glycosyltransferase involved in cell wall biosynthesis